MIVKDKRTGLDQEILLPGEGALKDKGLNLATQAARDGRV